MYRAGGARPSGTAVPARGGARLGIALANHLAVKLTLSASFCQRKRHYWRLDCKCITLFQNNTTNRYYKVGPRPPPSLPSSSSRGHPRS